MIVILLPPSLVLESLQTFFQWHFRVWLRVYQWAEAASLVVCRDVLELELGLRYDFPVGDIGTRLHSALDTLVRQ